MDATPFSRFGDGKIYSLHSVIDDATDEIVDPYMTRNECLQGYLETVRQIILNHGIPINIYSDKHAIFLSVKAKKLTIEDELEGKVCNDTQFGRAMKELGITIIAARSPQAKGRVERLWDTLQSRLPVEFIIAHITTIEQANEFLKSYIPQFNKQFSVEPQESESAFRTPTEKHDLDRILCVKQKRKTDNGGVFSLYGKHFIVVPKENQSSIPAKASINIFISSITGVRVEYKGIIYETLPFSLKRLTMLITLLKSINQLPILLQIHTITNMDRALLKELHLKKRASRYLRCSRKFPLANSKTWLNFQCPIKALHFRRCQGTVE